MISVLVAALAIRLNPAQALGIGSTKKSPKGDVELMYIPAGEFTMELGAFTRAGCAGFQQFVQLFEFVFEFIQFERRRLRYPPCG